MVVVKSKSKILAHKAEVRKTDLSYFYENHKISDQCLSAITLEYIGLVTFIVKRQLSKPLVDFPKMPFFF